MTIPEETYSNTTDSTGGQWHRRIFQAPRGAPWVPAAFHQLAGVPAMPNLRDLRVEADGQWSVEEFYIPGQVPLSQFLTQSAAPVWVFVSIVQQCLSGIVALHQLGFRHGVVGPNTLLVNAAGQVVLASCGGGGEWQASEPPADGSPPPLPHALLLQDLRDLGRTFRQVLGGTADEKLTVTRSDIAPLIAEWIDWLADPEPGLEAASAQHAETTFNEIRTGRPGHRPWKHRHELPPEIGHAAPVSGRAPRRQGRRFLQAHGFGDDWRPYIIAALLIVGLLAGGIWLLGRHFQNQNDEKPPALTGGQQPPVMQSRAEPGLPDEMAGIFDLTGGDTEPVSDTAAVIAALAKLAAQRPPPPPPAAPGAELRKQEMEKELRRREEEARLAGTGQKPQPRDQLTWLSQPEIFPAVGTTSPGREEGDYYLAWITQGFMFTDDEARAVQSAILRTARYCGLRVMAWTVLPNQAAVVLRVPPPSVIPDEKLERRIAILRGQKTASSVSRQINDLLKEGNHEGADGVRRKWITSMGTAAGFLSVLRTVPVVAPGVLAGRPLWHVEPYHLRLLNPRKPDLLAAATIVDTAAVRAELCHSANEWPLCSLTAAILNYGPALRAVSVLMQRNPHASLPVPSKENLLADLAEYRRRVGDLPAQPVPAVIFPNTTAPLKPAVPVPPLTAQPQANNP